MKTIKKKILLGLFSLFIILAFAPFAKATIIISPPLEVYNLGDTLDIDVKTSYGQEFSGFLRVVLTCREETETLRYFSPLKLKANKEKNTAIEWPISKALGFCHVSASLEDETSKLEEINSAEFELMDRIDIEASPDKNNLKPLDNLKISGKATLANGQVFDGTVIIAFDEKEYPVSASSGSFSFSTQLAKDISPGSQAIVINAKDNYDNSGNLELNLEVAAIPTSLIIETNNKNKSFLPGELLIIEPRLLDQAQGIIDGNILIKLSTLEKSLLEKETALLEELVASSNSTIYRFAKDAKPGDYLIEAKVMEFETEKKIIVLVLEKLNFSIKNSTFYITNIGNVRYSKLIELRFKIENQTTKKIIDLDLDVGETQIFELEAPKGAYEIEIITGNKTAIFPDVPLTGGVVTVLELKPKSNINNKFWIFFAVIIALTILVFVLYFTKKDKYKYPYNKTSINNKHKHGKKHEKISIGAGAGAVPKTDSDIKAAFKKHSKDLAAHSLIPALVYGTKQELTTAVVSIPDTKSKSEGLNKEESAKILDNFFSAAVEKIKSKQGVADIHGNSLIIMFNIVKQYRHDVAAIKTCQEIRNIGAKLNLRTKIGINTGMAMVGSIKPDKSMKYTQMANSIAVAKALAEKARDKEILLSGNVQRRTSSVIKTRKVSPYYLSDKEAIEVYALEDATPKEIRDKHKWFVDRAIGRGI